MFHRFSDETSFFVATMNQRPVGLETPFSIQLADRRPVLQGTCVVLAAWPTPDNPFKRPGVRLGIRRLTPDSQGVFDRLQQARANLESTNEVSIDTGLEPFNETPVAIIPTGTGQSPRLPRAATGTTNLIAHPRTTTGTQRRLGSVVAPAMIPPKTPPEADVLEVILPIVADSPSEAVALPIEVEPPPEPMRTPGSDFILPANPLMNLTDDSLKGFIDCTLYEDHANFPVETDLPQIIPAIPLMAGDEQVLVARTETNQVLVARTGTTIPPPLGRRTGTTIPPTLRLDQNVLREEPSQVSVPIPIARTRTGTLPPAIRIEPSGLLRVDHPTGQSEPLRIETQSGHSGQLRLEPSGLLMIDGDQGQSGLLRVDGASGLLTVEPAPPMPPPFPMPAGNTQPPPFPSQPRFYPDVPTPVPAGEAFLATETRRSGPSWLTRRVMIAGGAAAASLLVVILIAVATRSSGASTEQPRSATPPPAPSMPVVTKATPPAPAVAAPESKEPKEPDPDPAAEGPVVVGDGPCKLEVSTSPAGTMVVFDGRNVGASPMTIAGSCDRHKVDVAHPRYKAEARSVQLVEGKPTTLDVTLVRPTHNLKILTSPPGAEVFIGGRRAGTSPTMVQINGFSGIDVRIERAGFKSVSKRFYSKAPDDLLRFALDPLPRPR